MFDFAPPISQDKSLPGTCASVSSWNPGRWCAGGPQSPSWWGPTLPCSAPAGSAASAPSPPSSSSVGSPRSDDAWRRALTRPTPLMETMGEVNDRWGYNRGFQDLIQKATLSFGGRVHLTVYIALFCFLIQQKDKDRERKAALTTNLALWWNLTLLCNRCAADRVLALNTTGRCVCVTLTRVICHVASGQIAETRDWQLQCEVDASHQNVEAGLTLGDREGYGESCCRMCWWSPFSLHFKIAMNSTATAAAV